MQEKRITITRQNQSYKLESLNQQKNGHIFPFILHRKPYKQLISYLKKGHWSQKQKLKYAIFLEFYKDRFQIQAKRRFNNIFDVMAIFIKTRNTHQCRSHHQKMEKQKFKIDSILLNTASKYHPRVYEQMKERYINEIRAIKADGEDNFQKFKQRIQKIQQKKALQKETISCNQRVLRSSIPSRNSQKKKIKKILKNKNKIQHLQSKNQRVNNEMIRQEQVQMVKKQDEGNNIEIIKEVLVEEQQRPNKILNENINIVNRQLDGYGNEMGLNQVNPLGKCDILQNKKREHMQLAYIHYNEYLKHINQANNIQFEIMRQNSMKGIFLGF